MKYENAIDNIYKAFKKYNGVIKTSEFQKSGFHNRWLKNLIDDGKIIRIKRGFYQWIDNFEYSEPIIISRLYPDAIICLNSALYYYGYIDRLPEKWHIAVSKDSSDKSNRPNTQ